MEEETLVQLFQATDKIQSQADVDKRTSTHHQEKAMQKRIIETPEEVAERNREFQRRYRARLTPEQAAKRRAHSQKFNQIYRSLETPEQAEVRRARNRENTRLKRALQTPDQKAKILAQRQERRRKLKQDKEKLKETLAQLQLGTGKSEGLLGNTNKTNEETNGHERFRLPSNTMQCDIGKHNSTEVKNEALQDDSSILDCSATSFITQETFQSNTDFNPLPDVCTTKVKLKTKRIQTKRTPEEIIDKGLAGNREFMGRDRAGETTEQAAKRRARNRKFNKMYRALETPEQTELRRARNREYMRLKRAEETPDKKEQIKAQRREKRRKLKQDKEILTETLRLKRARKTPSKQTKSKAQRRERRRKLNQDKEILRKTEVRLQKLEAVNSEGLSDNTNKTKESTDEHEHFQLSSNTMQCDTGSHNSTEVKYEVFQDDLSILECSETNLDAPQTCQSNTDFKLSLDASTTEVKLKNTRVRKKRTPEEIIAKNRARTREFRRKYRTVETPEQVAKRRARNREFNQQYRALETPEQAELRRARNREYMRLKRAEETPDEKEKNKAERRERRRKLKQNKEILKETLRLKRADETPDEKERKKAQRQERRRKLKQDKEILKEALRLKRAEEIPKKKERKKAQRQERRRKLKQDMEILKEALVRRIPGAKESEGFLDNTNADTNGHERIRLPSNTMQCDKGEKNSPEVKNEALQDDLSILDCPETSFITQDTFQSNADFNPLPDVFTTNMVRKTKRVKTKRTPEERIAKRLARSREYRRWKRTRETPEQKAKRCARRREQDREHRRKQKILREKLARLLLGHEEGICDNNAMEKQKKRIQDEWSKLECSESGLSKLSLKDVLEIQKKKAKVWN